MTYLKKAAGLALCAGALCLSAAANAAVVCSGPVTIVSLNAAGLMSINNGFGGFYYCSIKGDITTPTSSTPIAEKICTSIYAMALTAQSTHRNLNIYLSNDNDCSNFYDSNGWNAKYIYQFWISN